VTTWSALASMPPSRKARATDLRDLLDGGKAVGEGGALVLIRFDLTTQATDSRP